MAVKKTTRKQTLKRDDPSRVATETKKTPLSEKEIFNILAESEAEGLFSIADFFPRAVRSSYKIHLEWEEMDTRLSVALEHFGSTPLEEVERALDPIYAKGGSRAFWIGYHIGQLCHGVEHGSALKELNRTVGGVGRKADLDAQPHAYIRTAVLEIAKAEGITTPKALASHLGRSKGRFKCDVDKKSRRYTFTDREAPAPKRKKDLVAWDLSWQGLSKALKHHGGEASED